MTQRKLNLVIFFSVLLIIAGYLIFNFFFNIGVVEVTGQAPFKFVIDNKETVCSTDTCSVSLLKGKYTLKATKVNYIDEQIDVIVDRGKTTKINIYFDFIPVVSIKGNRNKITINDSVFDLRKTPFGIEKDFSLRPLPDNFSDIILSPNMKYAFFYAFDTELKSNFLLNFNDGSLKKINLGNIQAYTYSGNDVMYFIRNESRGELSGKQTVNTFIPGSIDMVANFVKPIEKVQIFASDDENFIVLYDTIKGDIYLINLLEQSRKKILSLQFVKDIKFNLNKGLLLIGTSIPSETNLLAYELYDLSGAKVKNNISIIAEKNSIIWRGNEITYTTKEAFSPNSKELIDIFDTKLVDVDFSTKSYIVNYNIDTDKYNKIYETDTFINRIEFVDQNTIDFGDTDTVWRLKFKE